MPCESMLLRTHYVAIHSPGLMRHDAFQSALLSDAARAAAGSDAALNDALRADVGLADALANDLGLQESVPK